MSLKKFICYLFGHKWDRSEIQYREALKPIRRRSILNRKGGKKRTLYNGSFKIKTERCWHCKRCGKIVKKI